MECYACGSEPTHQCPRCRRLYCDEHGGELCADCLSPASALPSAAIYRGSVLALLAGTVVGLWLMIRQPGETNNSTATTVIVTPSVTRTVRPQSTRTPAATAVNGEATGTAAAASGTPTGEETATPAAGETPGAGETPSVGETPSGPRQYTVQTGDTLWDIASAFLPPGDNLASFADRIAAANGLDPKDPALTPGQVLQIPR